MKTIKKKGNVDQDLQIFEESEKVDEQIGSDSTALQKPEYRLKKILFKLSAYFME